MDQIRSIIAGVDFSQCSAVALGQAIRVGSWHGAHVTPVHVIEPPIPLSGDPMLAGVYADAWTVGPEDAQHAWAAFANDVPGKGDLHLDVRIGPPAHELVEQARSRKADLLVLGSQGTSTPFGHAGVASRCVRRAPCDVLLVKPEHAGPFRSVLVGIDFSETSRRALDAAVRFAAEDGAQVHALHVYRAPWDRPYPPSTRTESTPEYRANFVKTIQAALEEFCKPALPEVTWAKPRFHVAENRSHGVGIAGFAVENRHDLVVVGTRGHANVRDMLLGSTAERVVRDAPCSILAVRAAGS